MLLIGFGLGMSADDVDMFVTKALKEQRLNAKDPFEVIYWYCYTYGYSYVKYEQLWKEYSQLNTAEYGEAPLLLDATSEFKQRMHSIQIERQLMQYLQGLQIVPGTTRQSVMARKQFDRLYEEIREWLTEVLTEIEQNESGVSKDRLHWHFFRRMGIVLFRHGVKTENTGYFLSTL